MSSSLAKQHLTLLLSRTSQVDQTVRKIRKEQEERRYAEGSKQVRREIYEARQERAALAIPFTPLVRANDAARPRAKRAVGADAIASNPFVDAVSAAQGDTEALASQVKRARRVAAGSAAGRSSASAALLLRSGARDAARKNNLSLLVRGGESRAAVASAVMETLETDTLPRQKRKNKRGTSLPEDYTMEKVNDKRRNLWSVGNDDKDGDDDE